MKLDPSSKMENEMNKAEERNKKRRYQIISSDDDEEEEDDVIIKRREEFVKRKVDEFQKQRHSLRISASQVAALVGYHPYHEIPKTLLDLIYQGRWGQKLLLQDSNLLGIVLSTEEEVLERLVNKAGKSTKKAYERMKQEQHKLSHVQQVKQIQTNLKTLAKTSGNLNKGELKHLQEGVRSSVYTGFGTWNESRTLDFLQDKYGWEIGQRNEEIRSLSFTTHVNPHDGTPTLIPIKNHNDQQSMNQIILRKGPSTRNKKNENHDKSDNDTTNDTTNRGRKRVILNHKSSLQSEFESPSSLRIERCIEDEMDKESISKNDLESKDHNDNENICNNNNISILDWKNLRSDLNQRLKQKTVMPFLRIMGSIDGIRDELYPSCNDDWELRQVLVELKHRIHTLKSPPPLYDQIQTMIYCFMYELEHADIVQVLRTKKKNTKETKKKTNSSTKLHTSTQPHEEGTFGTESSTSSDDNSEEIMEERIDKGAPSSTLSLKCMNKIINDDPGISKNKNMDVIDLSQDVDEEHNNTVNSLDNEMKKYSSDNEETENDSNIMITKRANETYEDTTTKPCTQENCTDDKEGGDLDPKKEETMMNVLVYRFSLDDIIMQHRQNWNNMILPRLRSFAEAVYSIRSNDDKRYSLLYAMSQDRPDHLLNSWNIIFQECPWLRKCDTAFHKLLLDFE